nr:glycosyltransferase [Helleborus thibetanus]
MYDNSKLHIVMFPWLAIGHQIPFLELSKCLASKGHHISFLSTPRNIQKLSKIPQHLSTFISLLTLPLTHVQNLPENAESSMDIPINKTQLLKKAFDGLKPHVSNFLQTSKTPINWIIYDYASFWLPELADAFTIPCVFFCLFSAAVLSFVGPPEVLLTSEEVRPTPEDFTVVPKWIPFHSDIVFRLHEMLQYFEGAPSDISDVPDTYRFGVAIRDCEFIALRSCEEFEPEWISFLSKLNKKTVIPVGSLHPLAHVSAEADDENWVRIRHWLDRKADSSVVYVALGTESILTHNQLNELALGLERSGLPFFWVIRSPPESSSVDVLAMLPNGFQDRVNDRGVIWTSWAPQVEILAHRSVEGFLTHCGWNSVIEGLGYGRVPVMLPMLNDQGLNARLLTEKMLGIEIPRNERDGSFTSGSVAESLRVAMVGKEGEVFRSNARDMREVFGNTNEMHRYLDDFVGYFNHRLRERGTSIH